MELKAGYKQTEVGVIPEDWRVVPIGTLGTFKNGINKDSASFGHGSPFINLMDVFGVSKIDSSNLFGLVKSTPNEQLTYELRRGDVLFIRSSVKPSGVGLTAVIEVNLPQTVYSGFLIRFRDGGGLDDQYKRHCFYEKGFRNRLINSSSVSANTNINQNNLKQISIGLPPTKAEQKAIATTLSDTDALIESLEQLIAKKRLIKQGTMQELLTGKRRLPGFSGEWGRNKLGDVIENCSSGATPYRGNLDYYKGSVKWISSGELNYNVIMDSIEHISDMAVEKTNLKLHPVGTFLMAITGLEAAGTRGSCGIVGSPATTNQSCMAIYPTSQLSTAFLFHYYVFRGNSLAFKYCQGTKQQSYTAKIVKLLPIDLPPTVEEQTAIATLLSDLDTELTALESQLEKTRAIKQGMMQSLLTGRIRLLG